MHFLSYKPLANTESRSRGQVRHQGGFGRWPGLARIAVAALILGACSSVELASHIAAVSRPQGEGVYKVGQPYQINGVWYRPEESFSYDAVGVASWYGPGFDGKLTANGEIYDQNALTAAHPTLQMPSLVRVLNLENGRSVVVRINDRGPFANDRIIDLSHRAATLLGFVDQGTARVRVQVLSNESYAIAVAARGGDDGPIVAARPREEVQVAALATPSIAPVQIPAPAPAPVPIAAAAVPIAAAPSPAPIPATRPVQDNQLAAVPSQSSAPERAADSGYFVQAGAFSVYGNATRLRDRLAPLANTTIAPLTRSDGSTLYLVQLGPMDTASLADQVLSQVVDRGQSDAHIIAR